MSTAASSSPIERVIRIVAVLIAIAIVALVLTPANLWNQPTIDERYTGFDPNLIYIDAKGQGTTAGVITLTSNSVDLWAVPGSDPTIQLVTSPLSFDVSMRIRVLDVQGSATPIRACLWNSVTRYRACLTLGPSPDNLVLLQTFSPNSAVNEVRLGNYSPGQSYRLNARLDKRAQLFTGRLISDDVPPIRGNILRLDGGRNSPQRYGDVASDPIPVEPGVSYDFGGVVRAVAGADTYKLNVVWLDKNKNFLGVTSDWRPIAGLTGWTSVRTTGLAPTKAAFAELHIAAGDATQVMFAQLFFRKAPAGANLLANPDFTRRSAAWRVVGEPQRMLDIQSPSYDQLAFAVREQDLPPLFAYLRNYLEVSAPSDGGTSTTTIQDYSLTLPSQRWFAAKINDQRARTFTLLLGLVALTLLVISLVIRATRRGSAGRHNLVAFFKDPVRLSPWLVGASVFAVLYVLLNALLFRLGSMPFDMISLKVWSYTGSTYGMPEMYYRPFIATNLAPLWSGSPLNEPGYPYGITTAYLYTGIGWLHKLFLSGPGTASASDFSLEFLIKLFNVIFALADGVLVFLTLGRTRSTSREAALGASLFLLNPAVWFATSIWGQIESVALFFVLLSIYFAEAGWLVGAWLALAAAAFTKPQVMLLTPLLALIYLRRFSFRSNAVAAAWAIIVAFLFLIPFALAISPSLPVDVALKVEGVWGGAIDPSQSAVGGDSYSVWPLVSRLVSGQSDLASFSYPNTAELFRGMSYNSVSNLLCAVLLAVIALALALFRKVDSALDRYAPFLALALFGFLMLKTGMLSRYFIYCFPFLIFSRRSMARSTFYAIMGLTTITTLCGIFAGFVWETAPTPWAAPMFHQDNAVLAGLATFFISDRFITPAVIANLSVMVVLGVTSLSAIFRRPTASPPDKGLSQIGRKLQVESMFST